MDNDPGSTPDPSVFEAIKKRNNLTARNRTRAALNSPETRRMQEVNRELGTVTVTMERIITPDSLPSLGAAGYGKAVFSRIYEYDSDGLMPPDVMGIEAFDATTNTSEAYVVMDFGKDEYGEENIVVGVEEEGSQLSFGFSKDSGDLTDDIEDYDPAEPDGFISDMREVTAEERVRLEAVLNACSVKK